MLTTDKGLKAPFLPHLIRPPKSSFRLTICWLHLIRACDHQRVAVLALMLKKRLDVRFSGTLRTPFWNSFVLRV
jgi:hypothetical protein